jgi:hypothetical protein
MLWRFTNCHFNFIFAETLYSNQFVIMLLKAVLDYTQRSDSRSQSKSRTNMSRRRPYPFTKLSLRQTESVVPLSLSKSAGPLN